MRKRPPPGTSRSSPSIRLAGDTSFIFLRGWCARLLLENDVGCLLRGHGLGHPAGERRQIKTGERRLSAAEQNRRDHDMQPVDESRKPEIAERWPRRRRCARRESRPPLSPAVTKWKTVPAFHFKRRSGVMGEDPDWHAIGRIVVPPSAPRVVRPRSAHGGEHVAAENPGAETVQSARAKSSSTPVVPSSLPNIFWNVRVG